MNGQFSHLGRQPFPLDKTIECDYFEWACPREFGRFKIRFLCPVNEQPRRFFLESFLRDLTADRPSSFVDRACACGSKICAKIERDAGISDRYDKLWKAVFRHRNAGHVRVTRSFRHPADFICYQNGQPELIIPAPSTSAKMQTGSQRTGRTGKSTVFSEILREFSPEEKSRYTANDLIRCLQEWMMSSSTALPKGNERRLGLLDGVDTTGLWDHVTVDGIGGEVDPEEFDSLCRMIAASLINSPSVNDDFALARGHLDEVWNFAARIHDKLESCHKESEFDQWFKNQREHGFHRLLNHAWKRQLGQREAQLQIGKAFHRVLLWSSYCRMAHNWGLLMLIAWMDFCSDNRIQPDSVEQMLFRRMHAPQYQLAGLPIAFFSPAQLHFVAEPLINTWQTESLHNPSAYLPIAHLLAFYGLANSERREADRVHKRNAKHPDTQLTGDPETCPEPPEFDAPDKLDDPPFLSSTDCSTCGSPLSLTRILSGAAEDIIVVEVYCRRCDKHQKSRVRPSDFPHSV